MGHFWPAGHRLGTSGLHPSQLHEVARATTIASLMYASHSCWGFTSAQDQSCMERLINKLLSAAVSYLRQLRRLLH